jgi:predicted nucleotidyltransferase/biotin operon repressor
MARSSAQSAQRYPLTVVLGTEANVRLLRELSRHGGQLSAPDLVRRTGLAKTSVWAGISAIEEAGVASVAGTGRSRLYSLQVDHPLRAALDALFEAEEARFQAILEAVRTAARECGPGLVAVWLYGSVARGEDRLGSDLDIAVVAREDALAGVTDAVRDALRPAGEELGFAPSVVGLGIVDVARLSRERDPWWAEVVRNAIALVGSRPDEMAARVGRAAA